LNDLKSIPNGTKVIIDTNIILYTALAHPYYQKSSTDFLLRIEREEIQGFIPSIVVQEVAHHFIISELMELGYGKRVPDVIACYKRKPNILNDITKTWDLIPRLFQINCSLLYETPDIVKKSLIISRDHQLLIKDAYIVSFAEDHQITHIASNDHDFARVPWLSVWKPEYVSQG